MVIEQVHVQRFAIDKTKDDSPVSRYTHAPLPLSIACQRMQPVAGLIEVMRVARYVEVGQYATDAPDVARIQPSGVASIMEPPQSRVLDLHSGIFVRYTPCCNPEHPDNESISFCTRHVLEEGDPGHEMRGAVEGDGDDDMGLARLRPTVAVREGAGNSILWRMRGRYGTAIATTGINQPRRNSLRRNSEMNMPPNHALYAMSVVLMGILTGCARTSTLPLATDRIEITVRAAPICRDDADRLALQKAAVETIKSGFENFIVIDTGGGGYISGYTPTTPAIHPQPHARLYMGTVLRQPFREALPSSRTVGY